MESCRCGRDLVWEGQELQLNPSCQPCIVQDATATHGMLVDEVKRTEDDYGEWCSGGIADLPAGAAAV